MMKRAVKQKFGSDIPKSALEYITLIIKKMRYRKKVRTAVMAELIDHFKDELAQCTTEEEKNIAAQKLIAEFGDPKLLGILLRRAKKRCRPLWEKIITRSAATLILCFIFYCVYISLARPTIAVNYVEEATRLARPVVDDALNAAPLYQKAFDLYKQPPTVERIVQPDEFGYEFLGICDPNFNPDKKAIKPMKEKVDLLSSVSHKNRLGDLSGKEISAFYRWFADNAEAITFFNRAAKKPHCWWNQQFPDNIVWNIDMAQLVYTNVFVRMFSWQAKFRAHEGNYQTALEDLLTCYQAGRHFKGLRLLVFQLVGMYAQRLMAHNALIILDSCQINSRLLSDFQNQLEDLMTDDTYIVNYQVERFYAKDFIQRCYTDDGRGSGHMIPAGLKKFSRSTNEFPGFQQNNVLDYVFYLGVSLASTNRRQITRVSEEFYSNAEKHAFKSPHQLRKENIDMLMDLENWSRFKQARYWPITIYLPAFRKVNTISYRGKVRIEAVLAVISIIRHKQDTNQYPEKLQDLIETGYLKSLPVDPYSDKPLVYKRTDDDFLLYSVGLNFTDDGGITGKDEKGNPIDWADNGDAIFWPVGE